MSIIYKVLNTYEINAETIIIIPKVHNKNIFSFVKETDDEFLVLLKPLDIIKRSCSFFGASYKGRVDGTRSLIGVTHKPPIAINPSYKLYFFPTLSAARSECMWVAHQHVKRCQKEPHNCTIVYFSNQSSIILDISLGSFEKQLFRTAQLKSAYTDRIDVKKTLRSFQYIRESEIEDYFYSNEQKSIHLF